MVGAGTLPLLAQLAKYLDFWSRDSGVFPGQDSGSQDVRVLSAELKYPPFKLISRGSRNHILGSGKHRRSTPFATRCPDRAQTVKAWVLNSAARLHGYDCAEISTDEGRIIPSHMRYGRFGLMLRRPGDWSPFVIAVSAPPYLGIQLW